MPSELPGCSKTTNSHDEQTTQANMQRPSNRENLHDFVERGRNKGGIRGRLQNVPFPDTCTHAGRPKKTRERKADQTVPPPPPKKRTNVHPRLHLKTSNDSLQASTRLDFFFRFTTLAFLICLSTKQRRSHVLDRRRSLRFGHG